MKEHHVIKSKKLGPMAAMLAVTGIVLAPTRPGRVLAEAARRRLPTR